MSMGVLSSNVYILRRQSFIFVHHLLLLYMLFTSMASIGSAALDIPVRAHWLTSRSYTMVPHEGI